MRIGLDATPLLGARTGVGRYVEHLLGELSGGLDDLVATAFTLRGSGRLPAALPPAVRSRSRPVPARLLRAAWSRLPVPPVEWLTGGLDVFHATNFVLPPLHRARGVLTIHDLSFLRFPDTVSSDSARYRELVPRGLTRAAIVCTPSEAVAEEVRETYRLPADRVAVTPLGVDAGWFDVAPPDDRWLHDKGLPPRYLLAVGTLEPRKNLSTLVAAHRQLNDPAAALVVVGPPGWGPALDTAGIPPEQLVLTGYQDNADLRRIVSGAAALVLPSRYEGFGLPVLEALACGTPVIASDLPVVREVAGTHATLVAVDDVDGFAEAMATALARSRPEPEPGRAHARAFTWRRCADLTRQAYARAAASP